ncbi:sodium/proline symporter [Eubacterium oxidoreducens]|uniref:Sodium/proline symporter n=1 Tax=Eubacterium oxidoreducens TaxID=1732 RepID=A0A1G6CKE7_EUBOX|nr:sodium/proline symporter [Eubacterium oxidoreducens]SDB33339.1 sodium/proline symporter [Eubacterium oxidoreducens]
MSGNVIGILLVMIVYMFFMVLVGILYSRRNKDVNDFYLGGRKLGPLVTAMSAEASDMSSYLLMGLPGLAYLSGVADVGWTVIGLAVGTYLNWLLVSKRLRRYSAKANNSITIPEFFSNRFRDKSKSLLAISALLIVVFFVPYTASGFAACGKLFSSLFGVPYLPAMIISAIIIVAYTALGGFLAASTTDLIQSIVMTFALVAIVIFGIHVAGGWDNVVSNAHSLDGYLSFFETHDPVSGESSPYKPITILSTVAWGLGYFGMPHILLRFMGTESEDKLKISRRIATVWVVISMAISVLIGIVGYSVSKEGLIETFTESGQSETIIIKLAMILSENGALCVLVAGLTLAGILACTMSTSDSQLLAAASSVSQNLISDFFGFKISPKKAMLTARLTVLVIAIIGVLLALNPDSSVFKIVSFAWAGFGASFGPLMLFSLFWKRCNRNGALAGLISGGAMVFIWKFAIRPLGGSWDIYELLPAFIVSCVLIIVVSLATAPPSKEIVEEFESI